MPQCLVNSAANANTQRVLQPTAVLGPALRAALGLYSFVLRLAQAASPDLRWQARDLHCSGAAEAGGKGAGDYCGRANDCLCSGRLTPPEQRLNMGNIKGECFASWGHPRAVSCLTCWSAWHGHRSLVHQGSTLSFHSSLCWLESACIPSPRLGRFILYFCNSTEELQTLGFFAVTLSLGHYLLKHDQFGADGLKGSWRPIHYHQCRANLVLWVPFLQKQPPTDRNSAERTFIDEEVLQPPYFHTQSLAGRQHRQERPEVKPGSVRDLYSRLLRTWLILYRTQPGYRRSFIMLLHHGEVCK